MESKHPLEAYLDQTNESFTEFAKRAGISRATIYALIAGKRHDFRMGTLYKIEVETKRRVTGRQIHDWLKQHWENEDAARTQAEERGRAEAGAAE